MLFFKKSRGIDRIVGICYNGSTKARFAYTYNANGNITRHEDLANGLEYQYLYDGSGKLTQTAVRKTGSAEALYYLSKYEYDDQNRVSAIYMTDINDMTKKLEKYCKMSGF